LYLSFVLRCLKILLKKFLLLNLHFYKVRISIFVNPKTPKPEPLTHHKSSSFLSKQAVKNEQRKFITKNNNSFFSFIAVQQFFSYVFYSSFIAYGKKKFTKPFSYSLDNYGRLWSCKTYVLQKFSWKSVMAFVKFIGFKLFWPLPWNVIVFCFWVIE